MTTGKITISVVDAEQRPVARPFVRVLDADRGDVYAHNLEGEVLAITCDIFDNWRDRYTVQAFAKGYRDTGFHPVVAKANTNKSIALMMVPRKFRYDFSGAGWDQLKATLPGLCAALSCEAGEATAQSWYVDLLTNLPEAAAGLLNITTAMDQICLPNNRTALSYLKAVIWEAIARDRFFGYADAELIPIVRSAPDFAEEPTPGVFHPGATCSYKQTQFEVGNVQLTFHEGDQRDIQGVHCVKVEPDMDLYKDLLAHGLFEVLPNELTREPTDPKAILALRWMAGSDAGLPVYDALYRVTIEA